MLKKNRGVLLLGALTVVVMAAVFVILRYIKVNQNAPPEISATKISAAIVPHHDLAKDQRADLLKKVASSANYKTVILVSPDHFLAASSGVVTTDKDWKLDNAIIYSDKNKINELASSKVVLNQESAFTREHGITNILGDIALDFPNARLIPLIIRPDLIKETVANLEIELVKVCPQNCLLIASVDFSHYQPGVLAEIHDSLSIRALENLDQDLIWQAEVDSQQSLALAMAWAKDQNTPNFQLEENTNSGKIANEPDAESTSYVLGWYQTGETQKTNNEMTFMIGGDMMFSRYIAYKFKNNLTDAVSNLGERFFWGTDASIVNLEGPISAYPVAINLDPENLVFNFPPGTTKALSYLHLNAVSLANNHSLNAGLSGLENTKKVLKVKGIIAIGDQTHLGEKEFRTGEAKLTVFTINTSGTNTNISDQIKRAKQNGSFVIVFPHWGSEYATTHNSSQARLAKSWINAGADAVIGSHPHVIQDAEIYNNKPIIYSLGNLLFDQPFSRETQRGLVMAGKISEQKLTLVFLPVVIKNYQPQLLSGTEKINTINKLKQALGFDIAQNSYGYDMIELNR